MKPPPTSRLAAADVVLCSACLLGFRCRYDAATKASPKIERALAGKQVVPVCPEEGAGLGTPRPPADLVGGDGRQVLAGQARVVSVEGRDVSAAFLRGAELALEAAGRYGATVALLKEGSPSCGLHRVQVDGVIVEGEGVAAAALNRAGIAVVSDEDLPG